MHVRVKGAVQGKEHWIREIESLIEGTVRRFGDRIVSVDVMITDENDCQKTGDADKRCVIECRLAGLPPVAVQTHAATFTESISNCAEKLDRTLDHRFDHLGDGRGQLPLLGEGLLGSFQNSVPRTTVQ